MKKSTDTSESRWLSRNERQVCDGGLLRRGRFLDTVASEIWLRELPIHTTEYRQRHEPSTLLGARPLALTTTTDDLTMTPEIRNTDPMPVLFVRRTGPYHQAAGQAFGALCQFAGPRGLLGPSTRMIGISHDDPQVTDESKFRYDACVSIDRDVKLDGEIGKKTIPGGRYAVFLHAGPYERFQQTYDQIFKSWLPGSGERLREEPCFGVYLNSPDQVKPADLRTEIWLPLQ